MSPEIGHVTLMRWRIIRPQRVKKSKLKWQHSFAFIHFLKVSQEPWKLCLTWLWVQRSSQWLSGGFSFSLECHCQFLPSLTLTCLQSLEQSKELSLWWSTHSVLRWALEVFWTSGEDCSVLLASAFLPNPSCEKPLSQAILVWADLKTEVGMCAGFFPLVTAHPHCNGVALYAKSALVWSVSFFHRHLTVCTARSASLLACG